MLFSEVVLYLSHWERFCFNETGPKQVKRIGCNIAVPKLETSPHLGMWENKLALLENENWYTKLGMPCLWGTKTFSEPKAPVHHTWCSSSSQRLAKPLCFPTAHPAGNITSLVHYEKKYLLAIWGQVRELRTEQPQAFSQAPLMLFMVYRFCLGPGKLLLN